MKSIYASHARAASSVPSAYRFLFARHACFRLALLTVKNSLAYLCELGYPAHPRVIVVLARRHVLAVGH